MGEARCINEGVGFVGAGFASGKDCLGAEPFSRPQFVSDLLPASDGLFLGELTTPRRWDGSRLINLHPHITTFGGSITALSTWTALGGINKSSDTFDCRITIPSGMKLKLYALGQLLNPQPNNVKLRVYNVTTSVTVKETTKGATLEKYSPPYEVDGPATVKLDGWQDAAGLVDVNGFMVVAIE